MLAAARTGSSVTQRAVSLDSAISLGAPLAEITPFLTDPEPLLRMTASIALAQKLGPNAPDAVDAGIAEALSALSDPIIAGLPFPSVAPLAHIAIAAGSRRSHACFALAGPILRALPDSDSISAIEVGRGLLALAFGRCERPFMPGFLDILDGLATSTPFFAFNVNAAEVLRNFGLPAYQDDLVPFIAKLRTASDPEAALHAAMHGQ